MQYIDEVRAHTDRQIVVLIPVVIPDHFRERILYSQLDLALAAELRTRTDLVVARVPLGWERIQDDAVTATQGPAADDRAVGEGSSASGTVERPS